MIPATRRSGMLDVVAYAAIFVFGIVMALVGAVMPVLSERLALDLGDVGTVFLVTNGSMLVAVMLVGPTIDRFGMKPPLAIGGALVAIALVAITRASGLDTLLPGVALLGSLLVSAAMAVLAAKRPAIRTERIFDMMRFL